MHAGTLMHAHYRARQAKAGLAWMRAASTISHMAKTPMASYRLSPARAVLAGGRDWSGLRVVRTQESKAAGFWER